MRDTFVCGYTKALLDVKTFFENHSESIRCSRLFNQKGIMAIINVLIDNREELRETGNIENLVYDKVEKTIRKVQK